MSRTILVIGYPLLALVIGLVAVSAFESYSINVTSFVTDELPPELCLVIIDEDTIDNNISSIETAADARGTTSDHLVNDDAPFTPPITPAVTPPLHWSSDLLIPGEEVLLPGGQVQDEGVFALPPKDPVSGLIAYEDFQRSTRSYEDWIDAFIKSHLTQEELDKVLGVMPLRNNDLRALVGKDCIAVVYDSDISINYQPVYGNLQGGRYGLFAFHVMGVQRPGVLPEAMSDTSLVSLWLEVLQVPPNPEAAVPYVATVQNQEPDSVQIVQAVITGSQVFVSATSDRQDDPTPPVLNVSVGPNTVHEEVPPFPIEMTFNASTGRYEMTVTPPVTPVAGHIVTVSSDQGGAYNVTLPYP